jgi:hypothetical protein
LSTDPSAADRDLIARLDRAGYRVSPSQLVRWRGRGLLPRALVERPTFGGSRVAEHDEGIFEICCFLAQSSRRGRAWQIVAAELFEVGGRLSSAALRGAAAYLLDAAVSAYRRAWRLAEVGVDPMGEDPIEWVADVATKAARHMPRRERQMVRAEVVAHNRYLSSRQLKEAVDAAVVWRIADINAPEYLSAEQRNLARHGSPEPPDVLENDVFALPSERANCIPTLTWAEASVARATIVEEGPPQLADVLLLVLVTWRVTAWRLVEDFSHPERALTDEQLGRVSQ